MTDDARVICRLDELADPDSRAFSIDCDGWPLRGFVVRIGGEVFAYLNRCPHAGHPLNWRPDDFLTQDRSLILCRSHGAMFEPNTGECVAGPCAGQSLRALPVRVQEGAVVLEWSAELEQLV